MVIAKVTAKEGRAEEMRELLKAVAKESAEEPGCLTYRPTRGTGDQSHVFTIVEEYKSREDLTLHRTGKVSSAFQKSSATVPTISMADFLLAGTGLPRFPRCRSSGWDSD